VDEPRAQRAHQGLEGSVRGLGAASGVVKVYDGTDATGTQILQLTATAAIHVELDAVCKTGCFVDVSGGAAIVTVTYE